ncbi:hypothetical protein [Methanoregula sp.]|uniref:hypothetical protein n=1 Tax=Methanoregula sp. TaxID=2052170 RepID=UPI003D141BB8
MALTEACELIPDQVAPPSPVIVSVSFDEYNLNAEVLYYRQPPSPHAQKSGGGYPFQKKLWVGVGVLPLRVPGFAGPKREGLAT